MLQRVRIQNFRCLRDVTVDFTPLTALVGPNATGKTALVEALMPRRIRQADLWRKAPSAPFQLEAASSQKKARHEGAVGLQSPGIRPLSIWRQTLHADTLRRQNTVAEAHLLDNGGTNIANVFATMTRDMQVAFIAEFSKLVPYYRDIYARPKGSGAHRLVFQDRWDQNVWYEPEEVSDGTILAFAFLMLAHRRSAGDVMVIEDPEHGVHPFLLGRIIGILRDLAHGRLGQKAVQVILTTHSAAILNHLEPEEVRFLTRREDDGSTEVHPAPTDRPDWPAVYEEYQQSMGDLWLSGALGGVPGV